MRGRDIFATLKLFKDIFLCVEKSTVNNRSVSRFQVGVKGQVRGMGLVHRDIRFKCLGISHSMWDGPWSECAKTRIWKAPGQLKKSLYCTTKNTYVSSYLNLYWPISELRCKLSVLTMSVSRNAGEIDKNNYFSWNIFSSWFPLSSRCHKSFVIRR